MQEEREHHPEKDISSCKSTLREDGKVDLESKSIEELIQKIPTKNDPQDDNTDEGDILKVHVPLKRPRTAYFIFQGEKRPLVKADYPSESIGSTARRIGQLWSALTPEEKDKYKCQAAEERNKYNEALSKIGDVSLLKGNSLKRSVDEEGTCILPLARIRKICRLDPDVRSLSKEALLLITKAAEQFTEKLGKEANSMAVMQKRRTLSPTDVLDVCSLKAPFFFVRTDIQDIIKEQSADKKVKQLRTPQGTQNINNSSTSSGVKRITSYFNS